MMWHLIAGYLVVGLALVCLELGIEAMDAWTARRGMVPTSNWADPIWEVLLWPLTAGIAVPVGLGILVWRYLWGRQHSEEKEEEES